MKVPADVLVDSKVHSHDSPEAREDLLQVLLAHVPRQIADLCSVGRIEEQTGNKKIINASV